MRSRRTSTPSRSRPQRRPVWQVIPGFGSNPVGDGALALCVRLWRRLLRRSDHKLRGVDNLATLSRALGGQAPRSADRELAPVLSSGNVRVSGAQVSAAQVSGAQPAPDEQRSSDE